MSHTRPSEQFDVVIIGGGPAGSCAAYTAAKQNLRTCLIDKSQFPRDKLCAGLVTHRSKAIFETVFGRSWNDEIFISSNVVDFHSESKFLERATSRWKMFFTMRRDFDSYLVDLAHEAGAVLKLGCPITNINLRENRVTLENGDRISYRFLIGADGVNSRVAKELFGASFDASTIGFGLEVEVPRHRLPNRPNTVEIDFGAARWGYGWIIPKKNTFTIGVGGIHRLNGDLREKLAHFLSLKGLSISDYRVKGQYVPFGDCRRKPGKKNVLLCGDAAGMVDPITGEGIAHAMQSGHTAANAIKKAFVNQRYDRALDYYLPDSGKIASSIQQARVWRSLIFPRIVRRPFAWAFADARTLQQGYLDILAGKREYRDLYGLFVIQSIRAIARFGRAALSMIGVRQSLTG